MQVDRTAFTEIIERHQRAVYAVAFAITRDRSLADDLTQDTFVAAWSQLDELRDPARLRAWLCGIARNRARDALKRRRERAETYDLVDHATPFDALSDAQCERLLASALAAVPNVYREPLVLFYIEQCSVEDVASALGITPRTTNKRLSRGRRHLAARVEQLVAARLASRGPRRDLVPCVLAAIDLSGSASHVEPSASKGSTMLKLAVPLAIVATVAGAGLLAADSRAPVKPPPTTTTRPVTAPANKVPTTPTPKKPTPIVPTAAVPPVRAPVAPKLPTTATTVPDCAAVGKHLAQLTLDGFASAKPSAKFPAEKLQQFLALRTADLRQRCETQHWSDDRRVCSMGLTDANDQLACAENGVASPDEIAKLPPELQCDAVGKHLADLATAPGAKFDVIAKKLAQAGKPFDIAQMRLQLADKTRDQCEDLSWPVTMRRCIVASKTHQESGGCW